MIAGYCHYRKSSLRGTAPSSQGIVIREYCISGHCYPTAVQNESVGIVIEHCHRMVTSLQSIVIAGHCKYVGTVIEGYYDHRAVAEHCLALRRRTRVGALQNWQLARLITKNTHVYDPCNRDSDTPSPRLARLSTKNNHVQDSCNCDCDTPSPLLTFHQFSITLFLIDIHTSKLAHYDLCYFMGKQCQTPPFRRWHVQQRLIWYIIPFFVGTFLSRLKMQSHKVFVTVSYQYIPFDNSW